MDQVEVQSQLDSTAGSGVVPPDHSVHNDRLPPSASLNLQAILDVEASDGQGRFSGEGVADI